MANGRKTPCSSTIRSSIASIRAIFLLSISGGMLRRLIQRPQHHGNFHKLAPQRVHWTRELLAARKRCYVMSLDRGARTPQTSRLMTVHLDSQADLEDDVHALVKQDTRLKPILEVAGMPALRRREAGFVGLAH